jgi:molecular chaperone GrpE
MMNQTVPSDDKTANATSAAPQPAPTAVEPAGAAGNEAPTDQVVAELTAALEAAKNAELRALAELDNFRKRMRREQEEQLRYANWHLLADLLEVVDNLSRAVSAADQPNSELTSLKEGVKLVLDQLQRILAKYHCEKIPALGQPFDPRFHSAVGQVPSSERPPGTVAQVTREGYRLHERVLRPAEVLVTMQPPGEPPPTAGAST